MHISARQFANEVYNDRKRRAYRAHPEYLFTKFLFFIHENFISQTVTKDEHLRGSFMRNQVQTSHTQALCT